MPGISCICDFNGNLKADNASINRALDSLVHTPQYQSKTLLAENSYFLGYTAYDEYPVYTFENETYFICLEGRIYENDDLDVRLNSLAEKIFRRDCLELDFRIGGKTYWCRYRPKGYQAYSHGTTSYKGKTYRLGGEVRPD